MQIVYAPEPTPDVLTKSLFLAGPSPRQAEHADWRQEALALLQHMGFDGTVFVPLPRGAWQHDYLDQVAWEHAALQIADVIVFWVPRDLTVRATLQAGQSAEMAMHLPGFTTNMEFGAWVGSGKVILGHPAGAPKMRYLAYHAEQQAVPQVGSLRDALTLAVQRLGAGAARRGGARAVPLHIWRLAHFQGWYQRQVAAGNRLDGAEVLWTFRVGPDKRFTFAYALQVDVHVARERRNKTNEFIIGRPDVAAIVAYRRAEESEQANLGATRVALVREFRSPGRTPDGFIRELPGGSSWQPGDDPLSTMSHELEEETGLGPGAGFHIDPSRLRALGPRQLAGTLSVHHAHVFACELTEAEMAFLEAQQRTNAVHGVTQDTERTYVEVTRLDTLLAVDNTDLDWATLGMILAALAQ